MAPCPDMTDWIALGPNSDDSAKTEGCRYETAHAWRMLFVITNKKKGRAGTWTKVVIVNKRVRNTSTVVDAYILRVGEAYSNLVNTHQGCTRHAGHTCADVTVEYIKERKPVTV